LLTDKRFEDTTANLFRNYVAAFRYSSPATRLSHARAGVRDFAHVSYIGPPFSAGSCSCLPVKERLPGGPLNTFHSDDEIAAIACGLVHRTLPKHSWTHAAHFAAALWFLYRYSSKDALPLIRDAITAYNETTGVANTETSGYHETITHASLRAAAHFRAMRQDAPLYVVCNELLASPFGKSDWILRYWTKERLFTPEARKRWVDPDLLELPF
jgi:hypothetical protein